jgi:transcriptional regulator with XRE-family HTH domain
MFAQRVKTLREREGISQTELARNIEVMQGAIGNWETGKRVPDAQMLQKIANYFNVTVDFLLGNGEESPELILLARDLKKVSPEDRAFLLDNFKNTIDVYLKSKGH